MKKKFNNNGNSKKTLYLIIGILFGLCIVLLICFKLFYYNKIISKDEILINTENITILVATVPIKAGDYANKDKFQLIEMMKESAPKNVVTDFNFLDNQRIIRDLQADEILLTSDLINKKQWGDKDDRFVEHLFMDGAIPITLPNGNIVGTTIDIILFRQNQEDEIVVSKTVVVAADGNKLGFNLNEIEREYLKEAAIDPGGLYIIAYLDDGQAGSLVTYHPGYIK